MVLTAAFASPALAEFGPRVPVVTNGCTSTGGASDSVAQGADVVGFASFNCDDAIWMFTQHAGKWTSERTDVHGVVLGVARSSAGVWLLFSNTNGVYVARRTTNGWFGAGPRLLEPGKGVLGGSVIAS